MDSIRTTRPRPESAEPSKRARAALVSTFPPRHCGIATFTRDLRDALAEAAPDLELIVCAVDRDGSDYGSDVAYVIRQDEYDDYAKTAAAIADAGVGVVVIEHEYGIYGGPDGRWITRFADELFARGVPYLVTLHTLLSEPTASQAAALRHLCRRAFAVSVFTDSARRLAIRSGVAAPERILVVAHGAPVVLRADPTTLVSDPASAREIRREVATLLAESSGKRLVSTFGLISPGKGLETAIAAVAAVAGDDPDVLYIIAGSTHPEVVKQFGENYRQRLGDLVTELGIQANVTFLDYFLTDVEIALLLQRTEVFLTPYRSREQTCSGALTFALSAGCAVVSTDYDYARDMLATGAGSLVEQDDAEGFADVLRAMLADPARLATARAAAWELGRTLSWPAVGQGFADILRAVIAGTNDPPPEVISLLRPGRIPSPRSRLRLVAAACRLAADEAGIRAPAIERSAGRPPAQT